jgi:uncharacterized protein YjiS (DUF1127 family)
MPFDFLSAGADSAALDHRRRPDGSIDHDHYRRVAARERARAVAAGWGQMVHAVAATLVVWRERARQRRALAAMDDRMLRDIGISRFRVTQESGKPFWRA